MWVANAEQLVEINKMFAIIFEVMGTDGGEATPENMPPEFDLRVNGERKYWGFYNNSVGSWGDYEVDAYISFTTPIGIWVATVTTNYHNPVIDSFELFYVEY